MDIGEEITRLYYGPEQTFAEQVKQPLHVHPLFELALEKQMELRDLRIGIDTEEISTLLATGYEVAEELDVIAMNAGMFERPVNLTGEGIGLPETKQRVESGAVQVKTMESGVEVDELGYTQKIGGQFYGFSVRLEAINKDDTIDGFMPVLIYQIKVGSFRSPHSIGTLFATGDIGKTQLEFADDTKTREINEILAVLTQNDDEAVIRAVNSINVALAKKDAPDAPALRHVGHHIDRILGRNVSQVYIDALIDLIGHYVDWEKRYDASAQSILKLPRVDQKTNGPVELIRSETPTPFNGRLQQVVAMFNYVDDNGLLRQTKDRSFYMATYTDDASWYIRLTDLQKFDSL